MKTIKFKRVLAFLFLIYLIPTISAQDSTSQKKLVYKINIKENIMPAAWRSVKVGFDEAKQKNADIILIHLNTYGGMVNIADSIRTKFLNSTIPVWVFIDNQAASAGALISIACDSIYMRKGGSIGAATVVDQSGKVVPDKFQSFMRSTMRATAEAKGYDTIITGTDTILKWRRDPRIAEAMVDPSIYIEGIIDTGKVLTFTTEEAIKYGYCEGKAENINEVMQHAGIKEYTVIEFRPSLIDGIIGFLTNPMVSGLLIMVIIGGIYFELQTPGIGFPIAAAVVAAILYFAPLYIEGLVENWEIVIFILGVILVMVEIFAIPGFGITGISGIILMVAGLTLAMVDNETLRDPVSFNILTILKPFGIVVLSVFLGLIAGIYLSRKVLTSSLFPNLALQNNLHNEDGYIGIDSKIKSKVGAEGTAITTLRPAGKVEIDGEWFDAVAEFGYIEKGSKIKITKDEAGQLYVTKIS
jgi:membrane-bound serine protease (ClpP class)